MLDWRNEADRLCGQIGTEKMREASTQLSNAYREARDTRSTRLDGDLLVAAYLAVRFPATMAAASAAAASVASSIESRVAQSEYEPQSLLDLGAGCGAGTLALQDVWPSLSKVTAIEQVPAMVKMGKQILPGATWTTASIESMPELPMHDVVLLSYALSEAKGLPIERAWQATGQLLLIVEPGTPRGFETILDARKRLIAAGASIVAPCPSHLACPADSPDWCHFSARLNRSVLHKRLKGGTLGYEDEKYSYVAAWRGDLSPGSPRVIRHPLIEPGRIQVEVCEPPGRGTLVATKRDKDRFRIFRKTRWGDELDRGQDPSYAPKISPST